MKKFNEERTESWTGTGYGEPHSAGRKSNIVKFKNFSSPNKERTLSNTWQKDQKNDFIDTIGEITDDIYDVETETDYAEIEHGEDEFDMGLPDELDDQNRQMNTKLPRRNTLVDYGVKGIMTYNQFQ